MPTTIYPDWLHPRWPAPANIHALCTTRAGGVSTTPFDSLNLGDHVGDAPAAVQANRQKLQTALTQITPSARTVFLQQVHGTQAILLDTVLPKAACADACISTSPGIVCTIMVADCLPVLLTNRQGTVVAAVHAGWRGLAGVNGVGILEATFKSFCAVTEIEQAPVAIKIGAKSAAETLAWLGPCIGPQAFEVGAEVREAFCSHDNAAALHFQKNGKGKFLADLAALARQRLQVLGISAAAIYGNDSSAGWCTVGNPLRFFSHRQGSISAGGSGRMAACIWRG